MQGTNTLSLSSPSARLDAELLLSTALHVSRTYLFTHPEQTLSLNQNTTFMSWITERARGLPLAYLTGTREFWSLSLHVNQHTLIPRPETEQLVELTLNLLADKSQANILDLGTGSGAIALALAHERPNWQLLACDNSTEAVKTAQLNAKEFTISNISIINSDWFKSIPDQLFDAIVSNPPYIAEDDIHLTQGDVRFEPITALISGTDGLDALSYIIQHSYERLKPNGLILLEHGYNQADKVSMILKDNGFKDTQSWQDLQGHLRITGGWRKNI
jgi:release factor glutamine methyltransferase